jgi:hypothetical protein
VENLALASSFMYSLKQRLCLRTKADRKGFHGWQSQVRGAALKPIPNQFVVLIRQGEDDMTTTSDKPAYWLGRSKDVRDMAEQISDHEMKAILEEIARGYERIAEHTGNASSGLDGGLP